MTTQKPKEKKAFQEGKRNTGKMLKGKKEQIKNLTLCHLKLITLIIYHPMP